MPDCNKTRKKSHAAVIGGGLGGLAAACTLAARGHSVTLLEKNPWVGGKAAVLNLSGYRFDMGPTILLMPSVLRRIFAEAGRTLESALDLVRLDPQWRCFFADQSVLDLAQNPETMAANLRAFSPQTAAEGQFARMLEQSRRMSGVSSRYFFWKSIGSLRDTFDVKNTFQLSMLRDLRDMKIGSTLGGTVRSLIDDHRVAQMVDHFTQYVGSAPALSPAVLLGIAAMQVDEGVWYPRGGTRAVPEALAALAADLGVDIKTNVLVRQVVVEAGRVRAVKLRDGQEIQVDAVVCNSDVVRTHQELLPPTANRRFARRRSYEPACSGVVLYLGLRRAYPHLAHHNFVFSANPETEFHDIYRKGRPAADPTCYLAATSRSDRTSAPTGGEALYILVHTPYLRAGQDWSKILPGYRDVILKKLESCAGMPDIRGRIVCESALTPEDIRDRYHVWQGAIYGLASHGRFTGAFKPANRHPDIRGLYMAGGSVHPGPGMPMALMSGWIAADAMARDVEHVEI